MKLVEISHPDIYGLTRGMYELNPRQVWITFYHDTLSSMYKVRREGNYIVIENYSTDVYVFLSKKACDFMKVHVSYRIPTF